MVLTLNRSTVIGEYNLTMHYSGVIETEIGGYYRISYKSPNSHNISWLALTDFKPDKAHLLFPCFDHPMFKATFSLVFGLLDSKSFTISNMGKVEQRWRRKREIGIRNITDMEVYSWDHYDTTPLITTLGLAFIAVTNKDDFGFKDKNFVHYFYRKHLSKEMEFAMDMTNAIVGYFEAYFNSLYSLPNLHIFAVPNLNKYGVGSWGIILLSESQILNDPKGVNPNKAMYPIEQRKQVILNLSHKLVSQWFGTSVTMSDITEDWIFEGFALYMKYRALNSISKDEWNDPGHFNVEIMQPLLLMESLIPTVKYHENHEYVPDAAKGAVLMRMMENMITKETFDSAIMKLTDNKKLQVAGFMDICELLSDEAQTKQTLSQDLNLCDFLKPYVKQRGYPVLKLSRNYVTNGAMITQQQFILGNQIAEKFSESNDSLKNDEQMWVVPTSIINKGCGATGTQPKTWMPQKEEFSVGILTSNDWALLNNGGTGLYRVNYDKRNWDMIKKQLNTNYEEIATVNRAQIIDDVLNLARANMVDYYLAFEIIKYLPKEVENIPWAAALNNFEFFDMMLIKTPQYGTFKKFVSILIADVYQSHCDEKKESDEDTYAVQLHNLIGQWACHLDHPACTQYSIREFYAFKANPQHNSISVEERYMVYCTAIRSTTYAEWNFLWKQYLASDNQFEKELILKSLACTYDPWIIEWYLWHIVSPNTDEILIQPIHYAIIIEHLAKNPVASSVVIDKLLKHWKTFRKLSRSNTILAHMIKSTFFYMNTEPEYDLFKNWSRNNGDKMKEDYELFQHIEAAIENNIFFMKTYMWQVVTWMQSYVQNNTHRLPVSCDEEQNHPGFGSGPNKILGGSPFDSTNNDTFKPFDSNRTLPESPFTNPPGSFPPNIVHSPESPRSPLNVVIDEFSSTKVRQAPISSTTPRQAPDIMPSKLNTNDLEPQPKLLDQNQQNASEPKPSEQVQQRQMESSDKLVPSNAYSSENERSQKPSANNPEGPKIQKDDKFLPLDQRSDLEKFVNDLTQTIPDKKKGRTNDGREQDKETTVIEDEFEGGIKEKKSIEAKNSTLSSSDHV
ncbi:aminopeptidase N-like [Chrysoperla carnea]|uniref:aminopeptidase N-like n=1 Tax=Chrysoperla carnea TaxID=189513 RepID=UPI001D061243|nr:aminopeptidase N-like [Chrysoperla carnea]